MLNDDYHLIYDERGKEQGIETLLQEAIGIHVSESDGLHQAICDACLQQVIQTYEFKQRCLHAADDEAPSEPSDVDENEYVVEDQLKDDELDDEIEVWHEELDGDGELETYNMYERNFLTGEFNEEKTHIDDGFEVGGFHVQRDVAVNEEANLYVDEPQVDVPSPEADARPQERPVYRGPVGTRNLREFMSAYAIFAHSIYVSYTDSKFIYVYSIFLCRYHILCIRIVKNERENSFGHSKACHQNQIESIARTTHRVSEYGCK